MGMNVGTLSGSREPEVLMDVNTTPLIDVMLVLLVMSIITIPTQLHAINLNMGGEARSQASPAHVVAVDFDRTVYWDGEALANPEAVDAKMQEVGAMASADQPAVNIKPNKLVDYSAVTAVMASAQRHGVQKMGVVGNE